MADVIKTLTDVGLCSDVYYKELYLPAAEIDGKALLRCEFTLIGSQKEARDNCLFSVHSQLPTTCVC